MTNIPPEVYRTLFPLEALRVTERTELRPSQQPYVRVQDKSWTSFAILFVNPDSLEAIGTDGLLRLDIELTVEEGVVAIAAIDDEDKILDNAIIDAHKGRTKAELVVLQPGYLDAVILRTFNESPVSLTLHGIGGEKFELHKGPGLEGSLAAVYDLRRNPISFDLAMFLVASEMERIRLGLKDIHVIFAPSDHDYCYNVPSDYPKAISRDSLDWRFQNILLAMTPFMPSVVGVTIPESRLDAYRRAAEFSAIYPPPIKNTDVPTHELYKTVNNRLGLNFAGSKLKAQKQGLVYADQWLSHRAKDRKVVTITLRQYGFDASRNSDLSSWIEFAKWLDPEQYFVVFVPDTDVALGPDEDLFGGFPVFSEAAINLGLRMALYERAWLNCITNGGPSMLLLVSESCPFLLFRIQVEDAFLASSRYLTELGFHIGLQRPYCLPSQRIVWDDDSLETIKREFMAMKAVLDGN